MLFNTWIQSAGQPYYLSVVSHGVRVFNMSILLYIQLLRAVYSTLIIAAVLLDYDDSPHCVSFWSLFNMQHRWKWHYSEMVKLLRNSTEWFVKFVYVYVYYGHKETESDAA